MKISSLLLTTAVTFGTTFSGVHASHQNGDDVILKSVITELRPTYPLDQFDNPNSGLVWVNLATKTLHVDLYSDPCHQLTPPVPGYISCLTWALPRMVASFTTPLQRAFNATCDRVVYWGKVRVENIEIQISDNRKFGNTCRSYLPMPAVSGFLKIKTTGMPENEIRFSGVIVEDKDENHR